MFHWTFNHLRHVLREVRGRFQETGEIRDFRDEKMNGDWNVGRLERWNI